MSVWETPFVVRIEVRAWVIDCRASEFALQPATLNLTDAQFCVIFLLSKNFENVTI